MRRIEVRERADLDFSVAVATVELHDGRRMSVTTDTSVPERDLAIRRAQVTKKFTSLVAPVLGARAAAALQDKLLGAEQIDGLAPLLALATPEPNPIQNTENH